MEMSMFVILSSQGRKRRKWDIKALLRLHVHRNYAYWCYSPFQCVVFFFWLCLTFLLSLRIVLGLLVFTLIVFFLTFVKTQRYDSYNACPHEQLLILSLLERKHRRWHAKTSLRIHIHIDYLCKGYDYYYKCSSCPHCSDSYCAHDSYHSSDTHARNYHYENGNIASGKYRLHFAYTYIFKCSFDHEHEPVRDLIATKTLAPLVENINFASPTHTLWLCVLVLFPILMRIILLVIMLIIPFIITNRPLLARLYINWFSLQYGII